MSSSRGLRDSHGEKRVHGRAAGGSRRPASGSRPPTPRPSSRCYWARVPPA